MVTRSSEAVTCWDWNNCRYSLLNATCKKVERELREGEEKLLTLMGALKAELKSGTWTGSKGGGEVWDPFHSGS